MRAGALGSRSLRCLARSLSPYSDGLGERWVIELIDIAGVARHVIRSRLIPGWGTSALKCS